MASKIDSSEGSFMAELEGMESKRLEAATDYAGKLEDRYAKNSSLILQAEVLPRRLTFCLLQVPSAFSYSYVKLGICECF